MLVNMLSGCDVLMGAYVVWIYVLNQFIVLCITSEKTKYKGENKTKASSSAGQLRRHPMFS